MPEARPPSLPQFSRRIAVETPEHVVLEFELAGLGSRAAALIYDLVIVFGILLLLSFAGGVLGAFPRDFRGWVAAISIFVSFLVIWGYFVLFEGLMRGRTPGKRRVGIRVVMDTGHPVTFQAAVARNLLRLADFQPALVPIVGMVLVFFHRQNKRLGDMVAGTIVVRDQPQEIGIAEAPQVEAVELDLGPPKLSEPEFKLLQQFVNRMDSLPTEIYLQFSVDLANRFADRFPERSPQTKEFLLELFETELRKRQSLTGSRQRTSSATSTAMAHRFAAMRQPIWDKFRGRAADLQRRGVKQLSGDEVVDFAAQYREVAADLARARTYGVDYRVYEYLERVVAAGHNVLYGLKGVKRRSLTNLLLRSFPAAVIEGRLYVVVAFLLFLLPGIVGYALVRGEPEIANEILPPGMVARAETGQRQAAEGISYAEAPSPYLPFIASSIVANNIQVAFSAFAFGITAGIGTIVVLAINGLHFGSILGMFANYGLAGWILTFVAGHGVLELTAIFIAGGAGLLIGRAIVAPGDLTRRDALVVHGRLAIRLVGAAASLLVLAGIIEGFLSASDADPGFKYAVSATSAILILLYFMAGRRALRKA